MEIQQNMDNIMHKYNKTDCREKRKKHIDKI